MAGVVDRVRRYVEVVSDTDEDGRVTPLEIVWRDGRRFAVDRVVSSQRAHARRAGGSPG